MILRVSTERNMVEFHKYEKRVHVNKEIQTLRNKAKKLIRYIIPFIL